jgi:hypothetical protein
MKSDTAPAVQTTNKKQHTTNNTLPHTVTIDTLIEILILSALPATPIAW